jgi:hypothetical protein
MAVNVQRRTVSTRITKTSIWLTIVSVPTGVLLPEWAARTIGTGTSLDFLIAFLLFLAIWAPIMWWLIQRPGNQALKTLAEQDRLWAAEAAADGATTRPKDSIAPGLNALARVAQADLVLDQAALTALTTEAEERVHALGRLVAQYRQCERDGYVPSELIEELLAAKAAALAIGDDLRFQQIVINERADRRIADLVAKTAIANQILDSGEAPSS